MLDTCQSDRDLTVLAGLQGLRGIARRWKNWRICRIGRLWCFKQERWFYNQLTQSSERDEAWRVVGN